MCLSLMKEKWDVAIILDACRYDTFLKFHELIGQPTELESRIGATYTLEWLRQVFGKKKWKVVYVSGHPGINI